jgi:hypothetical protein
MSLTYLISSRTSRCRSRSSRRPRRAHLVALLDAAEVGLLEDVGIGQHLVVVELDEERDLVGILAGDRTPARRSCSRRRCSRPRSRASRCSRGRSTRVGGKARAGGVLDALVDRKDAHEPGPGEAPVFRMRLEVAQDRRLAIRLAEDAIDKVRPGQVELAPSPATPPASRHRTLSA